MGQLESDLSNIYPTSHSSNSGWSLIDIGTDLRDKQLLYQLVQEPGGKSIERFSLG